MMLPEIFFLLNHITSSNNDNYLYIHADALEKDF